MVFYIFVFWPRHGHTEVVRQLLTLGAEQLPDAGGTSCKAVATPEVESPTYGGIQYEQLPRPPKKAPK